MNDALYHYIDPAFSHLQVGKYTLLLLMGPSNFSLAVLHDKQLMVWRKDAPLSELNQPGEVQEVLNFNYLDVIPAIRSNHFTLVPAKVFDEDGVTDVARFLNVHATDTVLAQPFDQKNEIVFKLPEHLAHAAVRFNRKKLLFAAKGWLQAIAAQSPTAQQIFIDINDGQFDLAYFKNGDLLLFNTFEFSHEDELAYYAAFVSQQLKLDMGTITAVLSGNITPGDTRYHDILSNFFYKVELNPLMLVSMPNWISAHQLLSLTSLSLCASLADA